MRAITHDNNIDARNNTPNRAERRRMAKQEKKAKKMNRFIKKEADTSEPILETAEDIVEEAIEDAEVEVTGDNSEEE